MLWLVSRNNLGKEFRSLGPSTENARRPHEFRQYDGMTEEDCSLVHNQQNWYFSYFLFLGVFMPASIMSNGQKNNNRWVELTVEGDRPEQLMKCLQLTSICIVIEQD